MRAHPATPARRPARHVAVAASKPSGKKQAAPQRVEYGRNWWDSTRNAGETTTGKGARAEMERRRAANKAAFKAGKDRADLYTDAWDGSEWKGSNVNILTVLIAISVAVPVAGIAFAFWSYGRYWG